MKLSEIAKECVHVWGRTNGELDPLTLFWTGSGVELNVKASELKMSFYTDYANYEQWIAIRINGALIARQMLAKGAQEICIFRNMNPDEVKNVRIIKEVQAMSDDTKALLQITGVETDGVFAPVEEKRLKLEFIGDSITSGEGVIGAKKELDWISMFFSSAHEYATMVGDALDAEVRILSQSGWGTVTGWDNDPRHVLPKHYVNVCSLLEGEKNCALGCKKENDFSSYQPDAVVINLGTNDCGALDQPPFTVPETGEVFAQRKDADGQMNAQDKERLILASIAFLTLLREKNPKAHLVWVLGMLGHFLVPVFKEVVERYSKTTGDQNVAFLTLPDTVEDTVGARSHPGVKSHALAAEVITAHLKEKL